MIDLGNHDKDRQIIELKNTLADKERIISEQAVTISDLREKLKTDNSRVIDEMDNFVKGS